MDKTLIDYDKNLEELERQREKLEIVMQMMGQEWEESGAGIGWMGQLDNNTTSIPLATTTSTMTETPLCELTSEIISDNSTATSDVSISHHQPLFTNILLPSTGPSPEYLQSLLNVNESLLAQSLAKNDTNDNNPNTPMLTPVEEQLNSMLMATPLITPEEGAETPKDNNTPRDYMANILPDSEKINSPLSNEKQLDITTTNTTSRTSLY